MKTIHVSAIVVVAFCFVAATLLSVNTAYAQYTGNENHVITIDKAVKFIQNFKSHPASLTIKGGYFARNIFEKILAQPDCIGIRYYYAALDDGSPTLVLVGVDHSGNDIEQGVIGEVTWPCPPVCPPSPGQLNK
jgi:hypothetical protein